MFRKSLALLIACGLAMTFTLPACSRSENPVAAATRPAAVTQPAVATRPAAVTQPAVATRPAAATQPAVATPTTSAAPNPTMSPADVVKAVMLAMQHNDMPAPDEGIKTAFRFASPGNRKFTGPIEHFIPMVKNPAYAPLLNFKSVDFSPVVIQENVAQEFVKLVTPDDQTFVYQWVLSRQGDGEFSGCWMTDQVVPVRIATTSPALPVRPRPVGVDDRGKVTI